MYFKFKTNKIKQIFLKKERVQVVPRILQHLVLWLFFILNNLIKRYLYFFMALICISLMHKEVGNGQWDSWMASLSQRIWTWANSRRRWGAGKPGVLQSMWLQRLRHDLATEQQQCIKKLSIFKCLLYIHIYRFIYILYIEFIYILQNKCIYYIYHIYLTYYIYIYSVAKCSNPFFSLKSFCSLGSIYPLVSSYLFFVYSKKPLLDVCFANVFPFCSLSFYFL